MYRNNTTKCYSIVFALHYIFVVVILVSGTKINTGNCYCFCFNIHVLLSFFFLFLQYKTTNIIIAATPHNTNTHTQEQKNVYIFWPDDLLCGCVPHGYVLLLAVTVNTPIPARKQKLRAYSLPKHRNIRTAINLILILNVNVRCGFSWPWKRIE